MRAGRLCASFPKLAADRAHSTPPDNCTAHVLSSLVLAWNPVSTHTNVCLRKLVTKSCSKIKILHGRLFFYFFGWLFFYFLFAQPAAVHKYLRRWATLCKLNMHALRNQGYQCERQYALRHQPWQHCITKSFGSRQFLQKKKHQNNMWGALHHAAVASKHSSDDKKSRTY